MEKTNLMDSSLKDLKDKAVALGIPETTIDIFNTKAQVIAVIESLKPKAVDLNKANTETSKEKVNYDKAWRSKRDIMGRLLESQPKVGTSIPLEPGEKAGIVESKVVNGIRQFVVISGAVKEKIINGYKWILPKGVMTRVPKQVYKSISRELNVMAKLSTENTIDRIDPETKRPVRDALN